MKKKRTKFPNFFSILQMVIKSKPQFFHRYFYYVSIHTYGEGNGNPLQYSCLENPMDRGAW